MGSVQSGDDLRELPTRQTWPGQVRGTINVSVSLRPANNRDYG